MILILSVFFGERCKKTERCKQLLLESVQDMDFFPAIPMFQTVGEMLAAFWARPGKDTFRKIWNCKKYRDDFSNIQNLTCANRPIEPWKNFVPNRQPLNLWFGICSFPTSNFQRFPSPGVGHRVVDLPLNPNLETNMFL